MGRFLQIGSKFVLIVMIAAILFSYAMFQGGFVSWFLLYSCLPILFYYSVLAIYPIKKWKITRKLSHSVVHAGDSVTIQIRIRRSIPFPVYYCICEEIIPDSLKWLDSRKDNYRYMNQLDKLAAHRTVKKLIFPGFRKVLEIPYNLEQIPRGEHYLGAVRVKIGDPFGFIKKEHIYLAGDQLIAYPNIRAIHLHEQSSSFEQGEMPSNSLNQKNTTIVTGIREYLPGDRFSWIDWKQTARKNTIMTKEFEQEKSMDTLLILDSCHYTGVNQAAFEGSVELTVSLLEALRKHATQAELATIGEKTAHFSLHQDPGKGEWAVQHLTRIQPSGSIPFAVRLKGEMDILKKAAHIIVLTTHLDGQFMDMVKQLKTRSKQFTILFVYASSSLTNQTSAIIRKLQYQGCAVNMISEKELGNQTIEVNVT